MKFLLIALAVFGVAQAAVIQPKSAELQAAFDSIRSQIPTDRIIEIVQACGDDPEVQEIQEYLRTEFPAVVEFIRSDAEIAGFFEFLVEAGVEFTFLNHLFGLWGIEPIAAFAPKTCGGWRGVYELIQEEITFVDIFLVIAEAQEQFPEFDALITRIGAAEATIVRLLDEPIVAAVFERLAGIGVDLQVIRDTLNGLFGWNLS